MLQSALFGSLGVFYTASISETVLRILRRSQRTNVNH